MSKVSFTSIFLFILFLSFCNLSNTYAIQRKQPKEKSHAYKSIGHYKKQHYYKLTKAQIKYELKQLASHGAVILESNQQKSIFSFNEQKEFIPASTLKIVTAYLAIQDLGINYRFTTDFLTDKNKNLIIRGNGDPFLISEEIHSIASFLVKQGATQFNHIIIDPSQFTKEAMHPLGISNNSLQPYDALTSPLAVNFNSLSLHKAKNGKITSTEKLTPLTSIAAKKGKALRKYQSTRINLGSNANETLLYAGELFQAIFRQHGIHFKNNNVTIVPKAPGEILYIHYNQHTLKQVLTSLLLFSNNFIANQIFLHLGIKHKQYPASFAKSQITSIELNKTYLLISPKEITMYDGSGLSVKNHISALHMMKILHKFEKYHTLLPFEKSSYIKSGTLLQERVFNYVGFIKTKTGALFSFVIFLNNSLNNRDRILYLLRKLSNLYQVKPKTDSKI